MRRKSNRSVSMRIFLKKTIDSFNWIKWLYFDKQFIAGYCAFASWICVNINSEKNQKLMQKYKLINS